jgi:WD40 repeat protein
MLFLLLLIRFFIRFIKIKDTNTNKTIRTVNAQNPRHCVIRTDSIDSHLFYAGNFWGNIARIDTRLEHLDYPITYEKKSGEICGMSVCGDFVATGDNNNNIYIWDVKKLDVPFFSYSSHNAAVKALEFSPFNSSLLASAGGTDDRTIQIWDIKKQEQICIAETEKQTCNLHWMSRDTLFTTHGFGNIKHNQQQDPKLHTWKLKKSELRIAQSGPCDNVRMLYSAQNPNNSNMFFAGSTDNKLTLVKVNETASGKSFIR